MNIDGYNYFTWEEHKVYFGTTSMMKEIFLGILDTQLVGLTIPWFK